MRCPSYQSGIFCRVVAFQQQALVLPHPADVHPAVLRIGFDRVRLPAAVPVHQVVRHVVSRGHGPPVADGQRVRSHGRLRDVPPHIDHHVPGLQELSQLRLIGAHVPHAQRRGARGEVVVRVGHVADDATPKLHVPRVADVVIENLHSACSGGTLHKLLHLAIVLLPNFLRVIVKVARAELGTVRGQDPTMRVQRQRLRLRPCVVHRDVVLLKRAVRLLATILPLIHVVEWRAPVGDQVLQRRHHVAARRRDNGDLRGSGRRRRCRPTRGRCQASCGRRPALDELRGRTRGMRPGAMRHGPSTRHRRLPRRHLGNKRRPDQQVLAAGVYAHPTRLRTLAGPQLVVQARAM
mmetsp:Transcript_152814/g.490181  ORF Transcript_152814/g.490181 Transcript_152814/m.490181 type:complete len:350 (+) Transcript_152814:481-1530(+)